MRPSCRRSIAALALAGLCSLAACSAGGSQAAPSASASSLTDAQLQVLVDDLVRCIRANGAPGMPDVEVEDGRVTDPDEALADEATKRNAESALEACQSVKDRIPASAFEPQVDGREEAEDPGPRPEDVPALRQFAECMRNNGITEWPDPRGDGTFPYDSPVAEEGKSPRVMAAYGACRQYWAGNLTFTQ